MAGSLSPKHKAFCLEYIKDLNGTQAAIRAGYSKNCARGTASTLLTYPNIKAKISELMKDREKKTKITAERVVEELAKIAFSKQFEIEGFEELDMKDKLKALEMLAKHTGAFNKDESDKTVIKVKIGD
ncbi:terminase small subunit [uncultured Mediterranean phage uvMED]|nr:terminase small subunit [uncultured Mediterranean phage uvMED]BAR22590.1 Phage terminase, small subunit (XtmA) [uncultured Mediterranean phage uvMED]